jgi:hypothetical protein
MVVPIDRTVSLSDSGKEDRGYTVEKLESVYNGQYGEYKYYAGQVFVFKDGETANKTLLISKKPQDHDNRPYLKFRARPVYVGDTTEELEEVIKDWREEDDWYFTQFGNISGLEMPKEEYSICKDPMNTENNTVLISTKWIDNIQGDIFRIEPQKLYKYLTEHSEFRETLTQLIKWFVILSEKDIYPDYIGVDNIAIYLEKDIPHLAMIDRHIVWVGGKCNDKVKGRLDRATERFKKFLENPLDIENVKFLTSKGLM